MTVALLFLLVLVGPMARAAPIQQDRLAELRALAQEAEEQGDPGRAARAYLRAARWAATPQERIACLGAAASRFQRAYELRRAMALFSRIEDLAARAGLDAVAIKAKVSRACVSDDVGDVALARTLLDEVIPHLDRADVGTQVSALTRRADLEPPRGTGVDPAAAWLDEAQRRAREAGDEETALRVAVLAASRQLADGHAAASRRLATELMERAARRHDEEAEARALSVRARALLAERDHRAAAADAERLAAFARRESNSPLLLTACWVTAEVARADGDVGAWRAVVSEVESLFSGFRPGTLDAESASRVRMGLGFDVWLASMQDLLRVERRLGSGSDADLAGEALALSAGWKNRALVERCLGPAAHRGIPSGRDLVEAVRRPLGDRGELFVDYVCGGERLFAVVVAPHGEASLDLGPREPLLARARRFLDLSASAGDDDLQELVGLGRELYERLLAPVLAVAHHPPSRLWVCDAAELEPFPFEALILPRTADGFASERPCFVIERMSVAHVASIASWAMGSPDPPLARAMPGRPVLVVGHPATDPDLGMSQLPGTREEALAVASLYRGGGFAENLSAPVELLLDETAQRDRLLERLRKGRFGTMHFAAHGIVDAVDPRATGLVLARQEEGPDLLSVVDVLDLSLDADVCVLSACGSGRGRRIGVEAVQSLAWAFLYAGCGAVVASRWEVSDEDAVRLMTGFHRRRLEEGWDAADALRAAQLDLLHGGGISASSRPHHRGRSVPRADAPFRLHPRRWAAFYVLTRG